MTILPLNPAENASPEALLGFLAQCREAARRDGRAKLVSISLSVDALDPLAVLESIFEPAEPHFYAERPSIESAVAGAEIAAEFRASGPRRFAEAQHWIDETLAHTIAVGDVAAPFGGPHFFAGFTFRDEVEPGEPFDAASVFVPRWQVARAGATTTAVANLMVTPDVNLTALAERVWRAHGKFRKFEYASLSPAPESGTGVPPVGLDGPERGTGVPVGLGKGKHGRDAHATHGDEPHGRDAHATHGRGFNATSEAAPIKIRQGACLPHWTREGAIYSITFRLADSLPSAVLERWRLERADILARANKGERPLSAYEKERLLRLHSEKVEDLLDAGHGACDLRRPEIAGLVAAALQFFDGKRYELHEWCVMPNHVHAIVRPLEEHSLDSILHGWKSYTAKEANRRLGRTGEFWQPEYYDHLIRDQKEYARASDYVRQNPEKAGLVGWSWSGRGKGGTGVSPVDLGEGEHGRDAHATLEPEQHGRDAHAARATKIVARHEAGDYRAAVARALKRIEAGEFKKIVLARALEIGADAPLHPLEMLNGLRQRFPDCYAFSFAQGRGPSFIGASPERLVRVSRNVLETEALAGSMRRGTSASEDAALADALLRSEKDGREQHEVLDDIVTRLTPLGLKLDYAERPQVRRFANVQHLHTPVRATLPDGVRLLDVLAALHPTPAVGGSPREAAIARIRELEGFPRGLYAGALGWVNARGGGEFFVGIRSALVEGNTARLFAGAGIVAGSTPEKEFAETELKFKAMLDALLT